MYTGAAEKNIPLKYASHSRSGLGLMESISVLVYHAAWTLCGKTLTKLPSTGRASDLPSKDPGLVSLTGSSNYLGVRHLPDCFYIQGLPVPFAPSMPYHLRRALSFSTTMIAQCETLAATSSSSPHPLPDNITFPAPTPTTNRRRNFVFKELDHSLGAGRLCTSCSISPMNSTSDPSTSLS